MIRIFPDYETLSRNAADHIAGVGRECIAKRDRFVLVLAGGETPRRTYEILAETTASDFNLWDNTYLFWGDERCAPLSETNYHMSELSLLNYVDLDVEHIHPILVESTDAREVAWLYESEFPRQPDLVLLGMGEDGHIASLFPGCAALNQNEKGFAVVEAPAEPKRRITITPLAICSARGILGLASGSRKAAALQRVFEKEGSLTETPARLVRDALWFVDEDAAGRIAELESQSHDQPEIERAP